MGSEVMIRKATMTDVDGLVASGINLFVEDGVRRDHLRNPDWPVDNATAYETGNLADPDMLVLVAAAESAVIGHLTAGFHADSAMWNAPQVDLISLNVMPGWRGQGIGSRLLEEFKGWARQRGAVQARVTAYQSNDGAIRFYRRHGFAPLEVTLAADL
jgi:GNAT superfamily N-acetyltransferase